MHLPRRIISYILISVVFINTGCKTPNALQVNNNQLIPGTFNQNTDTSNVAQIQWKSFFNDSTLIKLIDTALANNYEARKTLQEINIHKNILQSKKGKFFPYVQAGAGSALDKVARYTSDGAGDAVTEITPGKLVPDPLTDFNIGFQASWEADIWGKLRNEKKAAQSKYLGSIEGRHFVTTNLIAEVANGYYELLSLDNQLDVIRETIKLQAYELEVVKVQKQASMVSELAVKQFEAQLFHSQGMESELQQAIIEKENDINFLLGRFPQKIDRNKLLFFTQSLTQVKYGLPADLLKNRPDIKRAEWELTASKYDVKAAKAAFYPSLGLSSLWGTRSFKTAYLLTFPESLMYSLAGDLAGPVINKSAIKAEFKNANAAQVEALYDYQQLVLNGFKEVSNQISNISNLENAFGFKSKQVESLSQSIDISTELFKAAKANYLEVLMAQRDALDAKLELIETRRNQYAAMINLYKALGGGWR